MADAVNMKCTPRPPFVFSHLCIIHCMWLDCSWKHSRIHLRFVTLLVLTELGVTGVYLLYREICMLRHYMTRSYCIWHSPIEFSKRVALKLTLQMVIGCMKKQRTISHPQVGRPKRKRIKSTFFSFGHFDWLLLYEVRRIWWTIQFYHILLIKGFFRLSKRIMSILFGGFSKPIRIMSLFLEVFQSQNALSRYSTTQRIMVESRCVLSL